MRDEREHPHPDVNERVDEEEAELATDLFAGLEEFTDGEVLVAGVDELEVGGGRRQGGGTGAGRMLVIVVMLEGVADMNNGRLCRCPDC